MADDFEQQEYFTLIKAVADFDQRLITIKGGELLLALLRLGWAFSTAHTASS
jgi:hypothetical protein